MAVVGVTGSLAPIFGTPTVFPLLKLTGGTLHVTGDLVDNFMGTLSVPVSGLGTETASHTFTGGGTIDLAAGG